MTGLPRGSNQHGFAPFRSTTTCILPLITQAINGHQNKPSTHTAVVALDLSKAFDVVDHALLIKKITASTLHSNLVLWLTAWLRGRSASCHFRSAKSKMLMIHTDFPQGSVLSPDIYNFNTNDFPDQPSMSPVFADDFHAGELLPDLPTLTADLNINMALVPRWAKIKKLIKAPEKSGIILFTPDQAQFHAHPQVYLNVVLIPLNMVLKLLGIIVNTKITGKD